MTMRAFAMLVLALGALGAPALAQGNPDAVVDLRTREGAALASARWQFRDARVVEADPKTHDLEPKPGTPAFDDAGWEPVDPEALEARRGAGRLSFGWYRLDVTVPERVGPVPTAGAGIVFEIVVDDYAEVWVDGKLPVALGQSGGPLIAGFNAPNRVVLTRSAVPGQRFRIAVFAANGPLSSPPGNFLWVRSATLDLYRPGRLGVFPEVEAVVERKDPALDAVVPPGVRFERLASGFQFVEGPVWSKELGALLFSDPNANTIYRWTPDGGVSIFRTKSGYTGSDIGLYKQPGSNGLAFDPEGRLTVCEHGNRRVVRLEKKGAVTVLADRFEGKRLNSPNDLVYRSDGALYFTDPPFGLPAFFDDPRKELPFSGVFLWKDGTLRLVAKDLRGPNGLAFSPDERFLYVDNWDESRKVVMRYPVREDGTLGEGTVFFDMGSAPEPEALDGLKVDPRGNLFVSGPGGVWILSPDGRHLGTLRLPELPANFAWGDEDGRTLYMTARTGLYRVRLSRIASDPRFHSLVPPGSVLEKIVDGRTWVEGPVWRAREGDLLFSDIPENRVYRWKEGEGLSVFLESSGYTGSRPFPGREPGSNGLAVDGAGRLLLAEHGDRRVTRLEPDGRKTVLADRFGGRRLNSPNDVVPGPDGALWITDPPFGLPGQFDDPGRELPFAGVYRLETDGELRLVTRELRAPNGVAPSPDGTLVWISNADPSDPYWAVVPLRDGTAAGPVRRVRDARDLSARWPGAPDGMKTDRHGNVFAAGPGGVYVFAPDGTLLGSILTGTATSNVAWGEDGNTLFVTADHAVWRIRLATGR
jgi:gluconolactonase